MGLHSEETPRDGFDPYKVPGAGHIGREGRAKAAPTDWGVAGPEYEKILWRLWNWRDAVDEHEEPDEAIFDIVDDARELLRRYE